MVAVTMVVQRLLDLSKMLVRVGASADFRSIPRECRMP